MRLKFNCSPKFDQKVNIPTRLQVDNICKELEQLILDKIFLTDNFIDLVGNFISHRFKVDVLHAVSAQVNFGDIDITAHYNSDKDENCKISIELILITNPYDQYLIFDKELFDQFSIRLADTLAHELIHMRQSRARDYKHIEYKNNEELQTDSEYLSNPDEIDAFAYGIAVELKNLPNPLKKLSNPKTITIKDSANLWTYVKTFSNDDTNTILKKLYKKIYKYLT